MTAALTINKLIEYAWNMCTIENEVFTKDQNVVSWNVRHE